MENRPYFLTTPIFYVNDRPHVGHAYTAVACDVMARAKRLDGYAVHFLTGTDEHGQKVEKTAEKLGMTPQALADANSQHFRDMTALMQISQDDFIRTTEPRHYIAAQALWQRMAERGHIYLGSYAGWYAVRDEAYYAEAELVDGKAPTGAEVEWVEEPSYFFRLSAFQQPLLEWFQANPDAVAPESRRNEVLRFIEGGLKDLSISRTTFQWGIPVPGDDAHVMYVWLDALANYLSTLDFPDEAGKMAEYWPAALHVVGKDILRFHAVFWPAFLMAADLPLPLRIYAHGWWTVEGQKMSKSLGNAIAPQEMVEAYGVDATRWFLLREIPFGKDGNFAHEAVIARANSELANNIGNLAQRSLSMVQKHCEAAVPDAAQLTAEDQALLQMEKDFCIYLNALEDQQFHEAAAICVDLGNRLNLYIDTMAPWKLRKEDPARMHAVLYTILEGLRQIAIMLQPFIPQSSGKLLDMLGVGASLRNFAHLTAEFRLVSGTALPPPEPVFPRLDGREEGA